MCLSGHSSQLCTCANLTPGLPTHHLNVCLFQAKFPANSTSQLTWAGMHDAIVGYSAAVPATLHLLGPAVLHAYKHSGTEGAVIPPSLTLPLPPVLFLCSLRTHQEALLFLSKLVDVPCCCSRHTPYPLGLSSSPHVSTGFKPCLNLVKTTIAQVAFMLSLHIDCTVQRSTCGVANLAQELHPACTQVHIMVTTRTDDSV
jgi:hypothetical protein